MPVHQTQLHRAAVHAMDRDALRTESAVVQALGVGVLQSLCDVANHLQALGNRERLTPLPQQVVQPDSLGIVIKDQRRAKLGFLQVVDAQDAGVVYALEHLEFATCLTKPGSTSLRRRRRSDGVDAYTTLYGVYADMTGFPILKAVALGHELGQLVITDLTMLVGGSNAGLNYRPADGARLGGVNRGCGTRGDAIAEGADDARVIQRTWPPPLICRRLGQALKLAGQAGRGQEDGRLDKGQPDLGLHDRRLTAQQTGQAFGFAIGQDQGVVVGKTAAVRGPRPTVGIAPQHPRAALDLDQEQTSRRKHQRIDFVDLSFVVDELKVGPDVPAISVGQIGPQPLKRLTLPGKAGFRNDMPSGCAQSHGALRSGSGTCSKSSPTVQRNRLHRASMAATSIRVTVSLYRDVTVLRFRPVRRETSEIRSLSRPMRVDR